VFSVFSVSAENSDSFPDTNENARKIMYAACSN
jgi:hypothetical protein